VKPHNVISLSKVSSLPSKAKATMVRAKCQTNNPLHSRNWHFPLDQVHCNVDVTNSIFHVTQSRMWFGSQIRFLQKWKLDMVI